MPGDSEHVLEKIARFGVFETLLGARLGKRLAWESGAQNVVTWNVTDGNGADISVRSQAEVLLIEFLQNRVYFGCKDGLVAEPGQGQVEAPEPGEEVNELKDLCRPVARVVIGLGCRGDISIRKDSVIDGQRGWQDAEPGPRTEATLKLRGHNRDVPLSAANGAATGPDEG
jgi:hypothetical protein